MKKQTQIFILRLRLRIYELYKNLRRDGASENTKSYVGVLQTHNTF